jgi:hypothetical protein
MGWLVLAGAAALVLGGCGEDGGTGTGTTGAAGATATATIGHGEVGSSAGGGGKADQAGAPASVAAATAGSSPAWWRWKQSLPVTSMSGGIGKLGGTEARSLVAMNGRLYAGIGYWEDSLADDPRLPGAQILALDSPGAAWRVDYHGDERIPAGQPQAGRRRIMSIAALAALHLTADGEGRALEPAVDLLLAGLWNRTGGTELVWRGEGETAWQSASLSAQQGQARSFVVHTDQVTGAQQIFAGTSFGIYRGAYDEAAPGQLRWEPTLEPWETEPVAPADQRHRVTSLVECNGTLYATVYGNLYERQDGPSPTWRNVYVRKPLAASSDAGFRGATAISNPDGQGQSLLLAMEDSPLLMIRVDPARRDASGMARAVVELNATRFLGRAWQTPTGYGIGAYNNMVSYPDATGTCPSMLIGIEVATPSYSGNFYGWNPFADVLVRRCDGTYQVQDIIDRARPEATLLSTRTMIVSPFAADPPGTIYAGGFDANSLNTKQGAWIHNTAWIYRGTPR